MKRIYLLLVLTCLGCTHRVKTIPIHISLINNDSTLKITGLDRTIVNELMRDSADWKELLPVFKLPVDTDLKDFQPIQPGVYSLKDGAVVFTPDTPFTKKQTYFLRYYHLDEVTKATDMLKGDRKLTHNSYNDLLFK